jgi:hypothetical protein
MDSVADPDPGSGAYLTSVSGSGMGKNQDPDPGSGSGMNNPDHISESLETIFCVKTLRSGIQDPGWNKFGSGIRDGKIWIRAHPGSAKLVMDIPVPYVP